MCKKTTILFRLLTVASLSMNLLLLWYVSILLSRGMLLRTHCEDNESYIGQMLALQYKSDPKKAQKILSDQGDEIKSFGLKHTRVDYFFNPSGYDFENFHMIRVAAFKKAIAPVANIQSNQ